MYLFYVYIKCSLTSIFQFFVNYIIYFILRSPWAALCVCYCLKCFWKFSLKNVLTCLLVRLRRSHLDDSQKSRAKEITRSPPTTREAEPAGLHCCQHFDRAKSPARRRRIPATSAVGHTEDEEKARGQVAASIWFEIWGVVDSGQKNYFFRQLHKKFRFFQAKIGHLQLLLGKLFYFSSKVTTFEHTCCTW